MASQNNGIEQPIFIESFSQQRRHWYTATEGDAVHRFPIQLKEIWNQYSDILPFDAGDIQALINDGDTDGLGLVTLRKNKALSLVPGTTHKYQLTAPDLPISHVITATKGQVAPTAGNVGPVTTAMAAPSGITGYTPVITDANGIIHPMRASAWVVDGVNRYVEFPYGVPANMVAPFTLTFYEYVGVTGGGSIAPGQTLWHYVPDVTSPFLTLCPDPGQGSTSHFVAPLTAQSTEGVGTRLMFDVGLGAVRAGVVTGAQWDAVNRGAQSVAFGLDTTASGPQSVVGGGDNNTASAAHATVGGGNDNTATAAYATVGGGQGSRAGADWSVVGGGLNNTIDVDARGTTVAQYSAILGGQDNTISTPFPVFLFESNTISGGYENTISVTANALAGIGNWVGGGGTNRISVGGASQDALYNSILGGLNNTITNSRYSAIYSSQGCEIDGTAGGDNTSILGSRAFDMTGAASSSAVAVDGTFGVASTNTPFTQDHTLLTQRLQFMGGLQSFGVREITGNTLLDLDDHIIAADMSTGAYTVTLPVAPIRGQIYTVKVTDNGAANTLTIDGNGKNIVDLTGALVGSVALTTDGGSYDLIYELSRDRWLLLNEGSVSSQSLWHYVPDATSPFLTLCPDPGQGSSSHFVAPLAAQSTEGAGTRLMFDVELGAVRGGVVTGAQWDAVNRGSGSVAFGRDTTASGARSVIGGGINNTASAINATVSGGSGNIANADNAVVSGGVNNTIDVGAFPTYFASGSAILGGQNNTIDLPFSVTDFQTNTISGGSTNTISVTASADATVGINNWIGGGSTNRIHVFGASAQGSSFNSILGGLTNTITNSSRSAIYSSEECEITGTSNGGFTTFLGSSSFNMTGIEWSSVIAVDGTFGVATSNTPFTQDRTLLTQRLQFMGGLQSFGVREITGAALLDLDDHVIAADMSAGAYTVTLPVAPVRGQLYTVKVTDNGAANTLTIDGNGKNIVNLTGALVASVALTTDGGSYDLIYELSRDRWLLLNEGSVSSQSLWHYVPDATSPFLTLCPNPGQGSLSHFVAPLTAQSTEGAGTRLMFDVELGAVRAGVVTGAQWDMVNRGAQSVAFGLDTTASGLQSVVGGGSSNTASSVNATVSGGRDNVAGSAYATVSGGRGNSASTSYATVGGGFNNIVSAAYATVGGGRDNIIDVGTPTEARYSAILGGRANTISTPFSVTIFEDNTISGGSINTISVTAAAAAGTGNWIGGGQSNRISVGGDSQSSLFNSILGGESNTITNSSRSAIYSSEACEIDSTTSGDYTTILGSRTFDMIGTAFSSAIAVDGTYGVATTNTPFTQDRTLLTQRLQFMGGLQSFGVREITGNTLLDLDDHIIAADMTAGAYTVTLPVAPVRGQLYTVKVTDNGAANTLTIDGNGKNIVNLTGALVGSVALTTGGGSYDLIYELSRDRWLLLNEGSGSGSGQSLWHYVPDAASPFLTLCPDPGQGSTSHFVAPLTAQSTEGVGTRLMFDVELGAVRGGVVTGAQWDAVNRGSGSVAFGQDTTASGARSVIGGGINNTASAINATVSGGSGNIANADNAVVGGGVNNTIDVGAFPTYFASGSAILGGQNNTIDLPFSVTDFQSNTISGGSTNTISVTASADATVGTNNWIGGGSTNRIHVFGASAQGSSFNSILGGLTNTITNSSRSAIYSSEECEITGTSNGGFTTFLGSSSFNMTGIEWSSVIAVDGTYGVATTNTPFTQDRTLLTQRLQFMGGLQSFGVREVTGATLLGLDDHIIAADMSAGAFTVTLPVAPVRGQIYTVKVTDNGAANTLTIGGNGKNIVDLTGALVASVALTTDGSSYDLIYELSRDRWLLLNEGSGSGQSLWHYVPDATSPFLTLCPDPGQGSTSHFVVPLTAQSTEGTGARLMFDVELGAVRGGVVTGAQWDAVNRGAQSVAFGLDTTASGPQSVVGGGSSNTASAAHATVSGGDDNTASSTYATVGGGSSNTASSVNATVSGGRDNAAGSAYATVSGGRGNSASTSYATVGGGFNNTVSAAYATVSGGRDNIIDVGTPTEARYSAILGGRANTISTPFSVTIFEDNTISGGSINTISVTAAAAAGTGNWIGGGQSNRISVGGDSQSSLFNSILGGESNTITNSSRSAIYSSEACEIDSTTSGDYTTILGSRTFDMIGTAFSSAIAVDGTFGVATTNTPFTQDRTLLTQRLQFMGGLQSFGVREITGAALLDLDDHVIAADMTAGAYTVTLPVAPVRGQIYTVKVTDNGAANTLTIDGNGKNIVALTGALVASVALTTGGGSYDLIYELSRDRWLVLNEGSVSSQSLWHYVSDATSPFLTLCPDPGQGSTSHFVVPLTAQSTEGAGTRLMFDVGLGAVRAGVVTGTQWNAGNRGAQSVAFGLDTSASGPQSVVGGGSSNTASAAHATVSGGSGNVAIAEYTTVGGGNSNAATTENATIGGGRGNTASAAYATVSGGDNNTVSATHATVGGGHNNTIDVGALATTIARGSAILGGRENAISTPFSVTIFEDNTISGGSTNTISVTAAADNCTGNWIGGGRVNRVLAGGVTQDVIFNSILGGRSNTITNSVASAIYSSYECEIDNTASGDSTTILGSRDFDMIGTNFSSAVAVDGTHGVATSNTPFTQDRTLLTQRLQFMGGLQSFGVREITGATLLDLDDHVIAADMSAGSYTATLPGAPVRGQLYVVKVTDNGAANSLTIDGNGKNIVDESGALVASVALTTNGSTYNFIYELSRDRWLVLN